MEAEKFNQTIIRNLNLDPDTYDVDQLWVISVTPPPRGGVTQPTRQFIAELYERAWDNSRTPCLYAGTSQGGAAPDYGTTYADSVIEGSYQNYKVQERFSTDFTYKMFDDSMSKYQVYKVNCVNDSHMIVSGLPPSEGDHHVTQIASMALNINANANKYIF